MSATHLEPTTISFLAQKSEFELRELEREIDDCRAAMIKMQDRVARRDWVEWRTPEEHQASAEYWERRLAMLRACLPERQRLRDTWWSRDQAGSV